MLIARAELSPGRLVGLRLGGGVIEAVGEAVAPRSGEACFDARGAAVIPGLHDHHLHLRSAAAARRSLDVSEAGDARAFATLLARADAERPPGEALRVIGYHDTIAGPLDQASLDALVPPGRPVRVQHRSGARWTLNTAALHTAGVDADAGQLWRRDEVLRTTTTLDPDELGALGRDALAHGVVGFTDATPDGEPGDARALARDLRAAGVLQHLHLMGPVGAAAPDHERTSLGPVKVLLDDATLPPLDELADTVRAAHREHRPVAVHCVTRVQLVLALAALRDAGTLDGDRIEHASVVPPELIGEVARLGLCVVTQPHFATERGDDYRREVDADDLGSLYRLRTLFEAGVPVAAGTDAPFGRSDPWRSMTAARDRTTATGHVLGSGEHLDTREALALYTGHAEAPGRPRRIAVGEPADLCVLSVPWQDLPDALGDRPVAATVVAGEPVFVR